MTKEERPVKEYINAFHNGDTVEWYGSNTGQWFKVTTMQSLLLNYKLGYRLRIVKGKRV